MKKIYLHGYYVSYDDSAADGIYYLQYQLDPEEIAVFFETARLKGDCPFEDQYNRNYSLVYNNDGTYTLIKRD